MHDCAGEVLAHHDEEVTLPQPHRTSMRERRDVNRDVLKKGLMDQDKPVPREFKSQGSYAMKTMVQHPEQKYDIDDGVYFDSKSLVDEGNNEMTALDARQMVRDGIDDGSFKKPPKVRKHCVRVYYQAGYHVDLPVYRRIATKDAFDNEIHHHELASGEWRRSDARDVTAWFEKQNDVQSPDDKKNGGQLRRITRQIKRYARSRDSWDSQILSGFGITKLVTECFHGHADREDQALYETMAAICNRLNLSLAVEHPITPNETITKGIDDPKARFLRDRLSEAIDKLAPLFGPDCSREKALKCWDKVFNTSFFSNRIEEATEGQSKAALDAPAILTMGLLSDEAAATQTAVRKEGGGRYA